MGHTPEALVSPFGVVRVLIRFAGLDDVEVSAVLTRALGNDASTSMASASRFPSFVVIGSAAMRTTRGGRACDSKRASAPAADQNTRRSSSGDAAATIAGNAVMQSARLESTKPPINDSDPLIARSGSVCGRGGTVMRSPGAGVGCGGITWRPNAERPAGHGAPEWSPHSCRPSR